MYIFSMTQLVSWIEVPSTVASVFNPNLNHIPIWKNGKYAFRFPWVISAEALTQGQQSSESEIYTEAFANMK